MPYRLAVANETGVVGTTTAINVAGALANRGHNVLFVDIDAQGNGTIGLGFDACYNGTDTSLYDVLVNLEAGRMIEWFENQIGESDSRNRILPLLSESGDRRLVTEWIDPHPPTSLGS